MIPEYLHPRPLVLREEHLLRLLPFTSLMDFFRFFDWSIQGIVKIMQVLGRLCENYGNYGKDKFFGNHACMNLIRMI